MFGGKSEGEFGGKGKFGGIKLGKGFGESKGGRGGLFTAFKEDSLLSPLSSLTFKLSSSSTLPPLICSSSSLCSSSDSSLSSFSCFDFCSSSFCLFIKCVLCNKSCLFLICSSFDNVLPSLSCFINSESCSVTTSVFFTEVASLTICLLFLFCSVEKLMTNYTQKLFQ